MVRALDLKGQGPGFNSGVRVFFLFETLKLQLCAKFIF